MIERAQRIIPDCRTYLLKGRGHLTLVYGDKEDIVSSFLLEVTSRISTGQIGDSPVVSKGILFAIGDKDPSWIKLELEKRGGDTNSVIQSAMGGSIFTDEIVSRCDEHPYQVRSRDFLLGQQP